MAIREDMKRVNITLPSDLVDRLEKNLSENERWNKNRYWDKYTKSDYFRKLLESDLTKDGY